MCNHVIEHIERMREMQAIKSENMPKFITDVWDMVLKNDKEGVCCICGNHYDNYGNNAKPFKSGRCCDKCDNEVVIPLRAVIRSVGINFRNLKEDLF